MDSIERAYRFGWGVRKTILMSAFGYVSHCKHEPSCGTVFLKTARKEGIVRGVVKSIWRVFTCV